MEKYMQRKMHEFIEKIYPTDLPLYQKENIQGTDWFKIFLGI